MGTRRGASDEYNNMFLVEKYQHCLIWKTPYLCRRTHWSCFLFFFGCFFFTHACLILSANSNTIANSVDPDETAHHESSYSYLHCFSALDFNGFNLQQWTCPKPKTETQLQKVRDESVNVNGFPAKGATSDMKPGYAQKCEVIANSLPCIPISNGKRQGVQGKTLVSNLHFWTQPSIISAQSRATLTRKKQQLFVPLGNFKSSLASHFEKGFAYERIKLFSTGLVSLCEERQMFILGCTLSLMLIHSPETQNNKYYWLWFCRIFIVNYHD